jgi:hypothetical protein
MANLLTGPTVVEQDLTLVSAVAQHPLGTRARDTNGNEYVYVQGVASGAVGFACTFDEAGVTVLLKTVTCYGPVGIMMAALVASTYGWVQVYGKGSVYCVATVADNGLMNTTSTDGEVDDASTTRVIGAIFRTGRTGAGLSDCQLNYPTVNS